MNRHRLEKEENLHKAFQYFDKDNSKYVCIYVNKIVVKVMRKKGYKSNIFIYLFNQIYY